jgi:23S rRNA (cytosine1962-C5)-methyltransferase
VYRGDIKSAEAVAGDVVRVLDDRSRFAARAFYSDRSQIALRTVTRQDVPVDREFLTAAIQRAADYRKLVVADTEVCRLVYGEGDLLPGVIVDDFAGHFVLQTLIQATDRLKADLASILLALFEPKGILERNDPRVRLLEGLPQQVSILIFPKIPLTLPGATRH